MNDGFVHINTKLNVVLLAMEPENCNRCNIGKDG